MGAMASQITRLTIAYSTVYSGADQRNHQSSAALAFVRGNHRSPVNSPHKWPITRKMFLFDGVIMYYTPTKTTLRLSWTTLTLCLNLMPQTLVYSDNVACHFRTWQVDCLYLYTFLNKYSHVNSVITGNVANPGSTPESFLNNSRILFYSSVTDECLSEHCHLYFFCVICDRLSVLCLYSILWTMLTL